MKKYRYVIHTIDGELHPGEMEAETKLDVTQKILEGKFFYYESVDNDFFFIIAKEYIVSIYIRTCVE